ncbi:putative immunity protein [Thermogemmatispora carboxidivorans]|uniref:putative immunity protein n=1 Tax=Thermogemmatispora carboxidivorans TaxID=1382306 RepID=UPI003B50D550
MVYDCSPNAEWHAKHRLPHHPTLEQRMQWHMEHARRCPCPAQDEDLLEHLKKRYLGTHQDFWIVYNTNDHRILGLWAADCAEHLLPFFEERYPDDPRPREAIRTLRAWAQTGEFHMKAIRSAALAAHASAKGVKRDEPAAGFAAHAAGQAVSTAHVPTHALGTVVYSIKLVAALHPLDVKAAVTQERTWQLQRLPEHLRPWVETWIVKMYQMLPKPLRMRLG